MGNEQPEFTTQLLVKLRMLIAVMEVAILKLDRAVKQPGADQVRLGQIKKNLQNTLRICFNARNTLEKKLGIDREAETVDFPPLDPSEMDTEIMEVPAITPEDIANTDIHELSRQLGKL